jgi:hypothetical protein
MKIKVKIAVAANADGEWHAYGYQDAQWDEAMDAFDQLHGEQRFWVEAEVEVAETTVTVAGIAEQVQ